MAVMVVLVAVVVARGRLTIRHLTSDCGDGKPAGLAGGLCAVCCCGELCGSPALARAGIFARYVYTRALRRTAE